MKTNEVKIQGKAYKFKVGLALIHWLEDELKTNELSEIIDHFKDINLGEKLDLKHLPKLALLVRGAVVVGSKKDFEDLEEWVFSNYISSAKVFAEFVNSLPGAGESDRELVGNLKASQKEAA